VGQVNQPDDLVTRLRTLEQRVKELEKARTLHGAVVSGGSFEVRTDDGDVIAKIGKFLYEDIDVDVYGVAIYRRDGTLQFWSWDRPDGGGYTSIWDESGNAIVADDTVSGQGLARPYVPWTVQKYSEVSTPSVVVTFGSFLPTWRIAGPKQHPYVEVLMVTQSDASTTGEVRLAVGGVQIGTEQTIAAGENTWRTIIAPVSGAHMGVVHIDVDARRTSGTGQIRVSTIAAFGRQT
jgi:hypothetical protein